MQILHCIVFLMLIVGIIWQIHVNTIYTVISEYWARRVVRPRLVAYTEYESRPNRLYWLVAWASCIKPPLQGNESLSILISSNTRNPATAKGLVDDEQIRRPVEIAVLSISSLLPTHIAYVTTLKGRVLYSHATIQ